MMSVPKWLARRPLLTWFAAAGSLGLCVGWASVHLPDPSVAPDGDTAWLLPSTQDMRRFDDALFQSTVRSKAWPPERAMTAARGGGGANDGASSDGWSLIGIVANPKSYALVLIQGGTKVERLEQGASLPDGRHITRIRSDAITVSDGSCSTTVRLYRIAGKGTESTCDTPQASEMPKDRENNHE